MSAATTAAAPAWLEAAARSAETVSADRVPLDQNAPVPAAKMKPRSALEPNPVALLSPTPADERDLAFCEYDPRTLLPSSVVLAGVTVALMVIATPLMPATLRTELLIAPLAALWLVQLVRWGYRLMAFDYRLTSHHLIRRLGRLYPLDEPMALATVARVVVRRSPFDRLAGTGTVRVFLESADRPPLAMPGIRQPWAFAAQIEMAVQKARERNVVAARLGTEARV